MHKVLRKILQILRDPTGEKAQKRSENNSFKKPLQVSKELQDFLKLDDGELISRSDVTKAIKQYATVNNLKNGQEIIMDPTLTSLLNPPPDTKVTYLNMQRLLKRHYIPPVVPVTEPTDPVPPPTPKKGRPNVKKTAQVV
jgi:upstream activation factor subunit UAF30